MLDAENPTPLSPSGSDPTAVQQDETPIKKAARKPSKKLAVPAPATDSTTTPISEADAAQQLLAELEAGPDWEETSDAVPQWTTVGENEDDNDWTQWTGKPTATKTNFAAEQAAGEAEGDKERVSKLIARAGIASRRAAEDMIRDGLVSVNGHFVTEPGLKADPANDRIIVDGKPLTLTERSTTVVLFHKPRNVMTTRDDPGKRATVFDYLPHKFQHFHPVGRLDFDTSGVMLLTDDGELTHLLTHPSHGAEKTYEARVRGEMTLEDLARLRGGPVLDDGPTAPCRARVIAQREKNALVEVTLKEGRNRQVRRMLEAVGHPVSLLRRTVFAGVELEGLMPGVLRVLLPGEVKALRKRVEGKTSKRGMKPLPTRSPRGKGPARGPKPAGPAHDPARSSAGAPLRSNTVRREAPRSGFGESAAPRQFRPLPPQEGDRLEPGARKRRKPAAEAAEPKVKRKAPPLPKYVPRNSSEAEQRPPGSFKPRAGQKIKDDNGKPVAPKPLNKPAGKPPMRRPAVGNSGSSEGNSPLADRVARRWKS